MKNKKMVCIILALLIALGIGVIYMMNNTNKEITTAEKTEGDQTNELPVFEFEETDSSDKSDGEKTEIIVSGDNDVSGSNDSNGSAVTGNTNNETAGSNGSQSSEKPTVSQNETVDDSGKEQGESSDDIQIAENGDIILPAVPLN